jgi:hypothetical protein
MFYMKRAEKKITPPESSVKNVAKAKKPTLAKKTVSVIIPEPKKVTVPKKKPVIVAEKATKKVKVEILAKPKSIAKIPVAAPKTKKTSVAVEKPKARKEKTVAPVLVKESKPKVKQVKIKIVKPIKPETVAKTVAKKTKPAEKKVEIIVPPIVQKPIKKKIKPIGSAVVRGKNGRYDFEVFSLDAELKDGSAIYLISKRITDKSGRGHHKFVCIGQTESLLGDIKKHKKDKCIKQHKANVVCLLREENETNRLKIETDLRQAHTIACNHQ